MTPSSCDDSGLAISRLVLALAAPPSSLVKARQRTHRAQAMRRSKPPAPTFDLFSELWDSLGRVPPERIRMQPPPGTATEEDVIAAESRDNRLCELIDGTLVEKTVGWYESRVALVVGRLLDEYTERHDLGFTFGEAGMIRVEPGRVRMSDVSFVLWSHFPGRILPKGQILDLIP